MGCGEENDLGLSDQKKKNDLGLGPKVVGTAEGGSSKGLESSVPKSRALEGSSISKVREER